jgi:hypothetical protein
MTLLQYFALVRSDSVTASAAPRANIGPCQRLGRRSVNLESESQSDGFGEEAGA